MKKIEPLTLKAGAGATPISFVDAERFFGKDAIAAGERRGELKTLGPWSIPLSYRALTETSTWIDNGRIIDTYTLHGDRTMYAPKQEGCNLAGRVSINGKKRRAFTSSTLFELPDGRLINVAVIHVCGGVGK